MKGKDKAAVPGPGRGYVPKTLRLRLTARATQDSCPLTKAPQSQTAPRSRTLHLGGGEGAGLGQGEQALEGARGRPGVRLSMPACSHLRTGLYR